MSLLSRVYTPVYRNTGSVARDHLASERTFLAWIRTGLGFIALGIAIERFSQLDLSELLRPPPPPAPAAPASAAASSLTSATTTTAKKGGGGSGNSGSSSNEAHRQRHHDVYKQQSDLLVGSLLGSGTGSIVYGTSRYFVNLRLLERGLFKPAYHGPAILSIFVAGLAGGVYWNTLTDRSHRFDEDDR